MDSHGIIALILELLPHCTIVNLPCFGIPVKILVSHIIERCSEYRILRNERLKKQSETEKRLHALDISWEWDLVQGFLPLFCQFIESLATHITEKLDLGEAQPGLAHLKSDVVFDALVDNNFKVLVQFIISVRTNKNIVENDDGPVKIFEDL